MSDNSGSDDKSVHLKAVPPTAKVAADVPVAKVVAVPQAAIVRPVSDDAATVASTASDIKTMIKKPEFIDRVVEASGMKKGEVKPIVEAALAVLGDALEKGEDLQLQPLGKIKVQNTKDVGGGAKAFTLNLRTAKQA